eukprot:TRINITY_DN3583_c0_g2_i2.p1 TRINITY_DN3583_c0_g2~~TRINITY_DN3583_c0_g2_i2.p1  ORF type:complete len:206 (+),score=78.92 TRINITY_DN3583_c0_g2_i2:564-1181(+)
MKLEKEDYTILKVKYEKEQQEKVSFLQQIRVFSLLPKTSLVQLADALVPVTFTPNKVVIKQGESSLMVYVIKAGKAKMVKHLAVPSIGKRSELKVLQLCTLSAGDYFGEQPVVEPSLFATQQHSVFSFGTLHCLAVTAKEFQKIVTGRPLEVLKKYEAKFPTDEVLLAHYCQRKQWERYKQGMVEQVIKEKQFGRRGLSNWVQPL